MAIIMTVFPYYFLALNIDPKVTWSMVSIKTTLDKIVV